MMDLNKNIEKILLGMKYDSRKTLSENKNNVLDYIIEKGADGLDLVLPKTTEVTSRIKCSSTKSYYGNNIELIQKSWPYLKPCQQKFTKKNEIDSCQLDYFNSFIDKCVENSVRSFKLDGLDYKACFSIKKDGKYVEPKNTRMAGYYTKTGTESQYLGSDSLGCNGYKWMGMENYREVSSRRFDDKGGKEGIEGGKGPEYGDSFSVELN